jgi:hypothetical protein
VGTRTVGGRAIALQAPAVSVSSPSAWPDLRLRPSCSSRVVASRSSPTCAPRTGPSAGSRRSNEAHGFDLPANFEPAQAGARRSVCAAAERGADLSDGQVQQRLLRVYLDGIDDFGRRSTDAFYAPAQQPEDPLFDEARALVRSLQHDGAPVEDDAHLIFAGGPPVLPVERFHLLDEPQALLEQLDRIAAGIANDPPAAIGAAKDLTESTLKFVLRDYGVAYDERSASLTDLHKLVANALGLSRGPCQKSRVSPFGNRRRAA